MNNSDNLDSLVSQAENLAQKQLRKESPERRRVPVRLVFAVLLVTIGGYAGLKILDAMAPPSREVVARDLGGVIDRAQQEVDAYQRTNGEFPPALPNAALASVVDYQLQDRNYRLTAAAFGVRVSFERDVGKITEFEK